MPAHGGHCVGQGGGGCGVCAVSSKISVPRVTTLHSTGVPVQRRLRDAQNSLLAFTVAALRPSP